jgi:hypothetical protein
MSNERINLLTPNPFISSPGDLLCHWTANLISQVPQFKKVFGSFIEGYMRMDHAIRNLPAVRIYQEESQTMEADNWFIVGTLMLDILLPANLRREELHTVSDMLSNALLQQFRRTSFFQAVRAQVPGLNYLGQSITISKNRAFQFDENTLVPCVVMSINFRIDLREWDEFLESTNRTVDDPFEITLANLSLIDTIIDPQNDDGTDSGVTVPVTQNV